MARTIKRVLFGLLLSALFGTEVHANTYTATSCAASAFQTAINSATDGDTVIGPSGGGSATWSTAVTVTKGITLNGNGCAVTWAPGGGLTVTADTVAHSFLTGFTFEEAPSACPVTFRVTSSTLKYRLYNNTFTDDGNSGGSVTFVCNNGLGPGLIDHNTFSVLPGADENIHNSSTSSPSVYTGWAVDVVPGSGNMLIIENNTFTYDSKDSPANSGGPPYYFWGTQAIENFYGAEVTFRYNTLNNVSFDAHGSSPGTCSGHGTENSTRWYEVYDNIWNVTTPQSNQSNYADWRGGSGLIYNNTLQNASNNEVTGYLQFQEDCSSGGTWPLQSQVGRGLNPTAGNPGTPGNYSPAYIWGNSSTMGVNSNNTTYVLVGTTPTDATNCSGHPGNVCDAVLTTSEPSLERCQSAADVSAGCPVTYTYTPFTYPDPLDTNPVAPPSNVTAVPH